MDERLYGATLDDLLTMRTGIEWHETDRPMNDSNTTIRLERAHDWVRFTLDQPMANLWHIGLTSNQER